MNALSRAAILLTAGVAISGRLPAQTTPAPRWFPGSTAMADFDLARDSMVSHGGRFSIRMRALNEPESFATVTNRMSPQPFLGKRMRFTVFVRTEAVGAPGVQLWARADDAANKPVAFINSQFLFGFAGSNDWTPLTVTLDVPSAAQNLYVGVILSSVGTLWLDDARIEADGTVVATSGFETPEEFTPPPPTAARTVGREAPRAITRRGLANLEAFTTALGYVRFFYPTAASTRVNWDELAVHGIRAVERAPTARSLAAALATVFAPVGTDLKFATTERALPTSITRPASAHHVVYWRHLGVGAPSGGSLQQTQSVYRSERVLAELADVGKTVPIPAIGPTVGSPPRIPDPARPTHVRLNGGVFMSVPTALYTVDSIMPDSARTPHPSRTTESLRADDRATRLADVALASSMFEHFYPYFDVVHTNWLAARETALRSAAVDSGAASFQATLDRLIAQLHDGHGNVYHARRPMAIPDVRLGWAQGRVFVTAIGDSAGRRGVHIGDELLAVDGHPVGSLMAEASERISGATPQWIRTRALTAILTGDGASSARLQLADASGERREASISRSIGRVNESSLEQIAEPAPGVLYVDLGRITDADFQAALPRLEKARAIIFDMRGYPSKVNTAAIFAHLTDSVIHSAHFEVPVITAPRFAGVGYIDGAWTIEPAAPRLHARIVFLSGGGAISYAESTLGVVEAYKLADIVGEPSAGTNGNVNPFTLPGGYNVAWTGMRVVKRDGTPHHGVGVTPTYKISPTVAGMRAGKDEVLDSAIALVKTTTVTP